MFDMIIQDNGIFTTPVTQLVSFEIVTTITVGVTRVNVTLTRHVDVNDGVPNEMFNFSRKQERGSDCYRRDTNPRV